jgi:diguanylate cyclase (GGDEF)-like protein/PAS domain S-box-containing protein
MPRRRRYFPLRAKLIAGVALFALMLAALLLGAHLFLRESAARMEASLRDEIQPLVRINRLQAELSGLRVAEIELPQLRDYFAVTARLERIREQSDAFSRALQEFTASRSPMPEVDDNWQRYKDALENVAIAAMRMDMDAVGALSTLESAPRYLQIARALQVAADRTEAQARASLQMQRERHAEQQLNFALISVAGIGGLLLGAMWLANSLSHRIHSLRDATREIAEGRVDTVPTSAGNDELTDLAAAFVTMSDRVRAREDDLRSAQAELERRVLERTQALRAGNELLTREVAEREQAESRLRLLRLAVEQSPVGVMITDTDARIQFVNQAFLTSAGYTLDDVIGQTPALVSSGETDEALYREMWEALRRGEDWAGELTNRRADGSLFWEFQHVSPVHDAQGRVTHYLAIREDVTARKAQEEKILFQAHYDPLTGLPNRTLARDRLGQAIVQAARARQRLAVVFVDLDNFKKVNDTLGHGAGDQLLVEAARRIASCVRTSDTVARLGGDEFLVLLGDFGGTDDIERIAIKLLGAFRPMFTLEGESVGVTPSLGVAVYPDDGQDVSSLLRNADLAMYDAKDAGRNTWRFFDQASHMKSLSRLALERDLHGALERGELQLHYQPLIAIGTRALLGAEALLRWHSPRHGNVSPERFIDIAEQSNLIVEIGDWVLQTACRQVAAWRSAGHAGFYMAVNVSPRQFRQDGFVASVMQVLAEMRLPASALQLEITEGVLMRSDPAVLESLLTLDRRGVRIAMDDFGTGYSSLSYLRRFPFHTLKIDREFIRDLAIDANDRALVSAAVSMGKQLGLVVVAEGVETDEQLACLQAQGCDVAQGYHFGRPVAAAEFGRSWIDHGSDYSI